MKGIFNHQPNRGANQLEKQFYQEIEKGKRLRATILIGLLGFEGIFLLAIYILFGEEYQVLFQSNTAIYAMLIFVSLIIAYESVVHYLFPKRPEFPDTWRRIAGFLNAFSEISLLSLLLVFIILSSGQTVILHSPAALTYFIFIILSTLRLDFRLSLFTGILAAVEFVLLSLLCTNYCDLEVSNKLAVTPIQYLGQGLIMVTAGIAAGFVAKLIKKKMRDSYYSIEERNKVIDLFGQQISQQIAGEILRHPDELKGVRKNVCIMFLDIRNFTPFTEDKEPEEVVAYLNSLFRYMIEIIQSHNGIINQFLGDGFMATFGAPASQGNICQQAVQAASEIVERTEQENDRGNIPPTRLGIGLHYGEAVTGNIGSTMRKQYSITGNVVILASRIEQLTKEFNTPLLFSGEVFSNLEEAYRNKSRIIGPANVKGREKPIQLFCLK